jgi:hypothetical protein
VFGMMHVIWLGKGTLDEWDYWAGTFGLVVFAVIETILFMWIFKPENAWRSIHQGADIRIPTIFKFIMTYVTPAYLLFILIWWGWQDAVPILLNERSAGSSAPVSPENSFYVHFARLVMVFFFIAFAILVRMAWKRNKYDDRVGFVEVEDTPAAIIPGREVA